MHCGEELIEVPLYRLGRRRRRLSILFFSRRGGVLEEKCFEDDDDDDEEDEEEDKEWTWTECSTRTMGRKKFSTI